MMRAEWPIRRWPIYVFTAVRLAGRESGFFVSAAGRRHGQ